MTRKLHNVFRIFLFCIAISSMMVACGGDPGGNNNNNNNSSNNNNNNNNGGTTKEVKGLCGAGCPKGQFCFNGICAVGCNTDKECETNQYCDTDIKQCSNKEVKTCPDTPCGANQECVNGLCSAKKADPPKKRNESGACTPAVDGKDGCKRHEVCLVKENDQTQCRAFPRCPQSGKCPVGLVGAVCNDKLIPNKDRICLVGGCTGTEHCPASWSCVKIGGIKLGLCSSGAMGMPCTKQSECKSGLKCTQPGGPTTAGFCLGGGFPFP